MSTEARSGKRQVVETITNDGEEIKQMAVDGLDPARKLCWCASEYGG